LKKPKPVISKSIQRRLAVQLPDKVIRTEHGPNCICLYCRSQREKK